MAELQSSRLPELPEAAYYISNFITAEQEALILEEVSKLPGGRWKVLTHRRLLSLPSQLTGTARDTLIDAALPRFLAKPILDQLKELEVFKDSPHSAPNHCLVNEYQPGQGIMPHEDGPAYHPITATVSLGSHTVLDIYRKNEEGEREVTPSWRILQEPRSLLITTGRMYGDTLHGIAEAQVDENLGPETIVNWNLLTDKDAFESGTAKRETRVSLTYRDVLKVAKVGNAMKFMNKKW
ncbi:hypothetical protein H2198_000943 [Neophaeococcomyces mojaviensis]|uniref:Uncharacterized protein n=1 Tax=Neophaeococcomyces mojaviensis TaxID=3383035 RepID=A0ACC3AID0_9EURO|nr:hypothetical protein H2198_000943 [Knufia sp. JES_112]